MQGHCGAAGDFEEAHGGVFGVTDAVLVSAGCAARVLLFRVEGVLLGVCGAEAAWEGC